ncbi:hypothetical protein D3C72_2191910 [compost metagenome]
MPKSAMTMASSSCAQNGSWPGQYVPSARWPASKGKMARPSRYKASLTSACSVSRAPSPCAWFHAPSYGR